MTPQGQGAPILCRIGIHFPVHIHRRFNGRWEKRCGRRKCRKLLDYTVGRFER